MVMVGGEVLTLVEPVTSAVSLVAGGAQISDVTVRGLRAVITSVPPGGHRRQIGRDRREQAYLRFQQAVNEQLAWAIYLPAIGEAMPNLLTRFLYMPAFMREIGPVRSAVASFLDALQEIRLVGNPEPRAVAEELAALVSELLDRIPHTRYPRRLRERELARFLECQRAIGETNRRFIIVARADLGYGPSWLRRHAPRWPRFLPRPKWWSWSWRQDGSEWPGGWPGPDPHRLIEADQGHRDAST